MDKRTNTHRLIFSSLLVYGFILGLLIMDQASSRGATPAVAATDAWGGPDAFGYTFRDSNEPDGPVYAWEEISDSGTLLEGWGNYDDSYAGPVPVGFNFNYYGTDFSELYVSTNGYISFGQGYGTIPWGVLPSAQDPNSDIALFGGDMYLYDYGTETRIYYQTLSDPTRLVLEIVNLHGCCSYNTPRTFEVTLYENGDFQAQYASLNGTSTDYVGIENSDGSIGLGYGAPLGDQLAIRYYYPSGVFINPHSQQGYGNPADTVAYTLQVTNLTGQSDSFDLSVQPGNAWTTTLSTYQVGPIEDGETVSFSAFVDIPPEALAGEVDKAIIQATSISSPDIFTGTATIQTTAASNELAYVTQFSSDMTVNKLAILDRNLHAVIGSVDLEGMGCLGPWRPRITPSGGNLYLLCQGSSNLVSLTLPGLALEYALSYQGSGQDDIAFSSDESFAFISTTANDSGIQVLDINARSIITTIPLEGDAYSTNLEISPTGHFLYAAGTWSGGGRLYVIDTSSFTVISMIDFGSDMWDVVADPTNQWVYASDRWGAGIAVINAYTMEIDDVIQNTGELTGLSLSADGNIIFAGRAFGGTVDVYDISSHQLLSSVYLGDVVDNMTMNCTGDELYIASGQKVSIINAHTYTADYIVPTPANAGGVAICPEYIAHGAFISPPDQIKVGRAGETVTYNLNMVNVSGEIDSYDLAVLPGSTFTTTLSANHIGPIGDGEIGPFSAMVEIPPSAQPGDTGTATVQATSVNSPTLTSIATINTLVLGKETAYITLEYINRIALVDVATQMVLNIVDTGEYGCYEPWRAAMSPDHSYVYFSCVYSGSVLVMDTASNSVITNIPDVPYADGVTFTQTGEYALVGSSEANQIAVIDTATSTILQYIPTESYPRNIVMHPYLEKVYATLGNGEILVIDTSTFAIANTIHVGGNPSDVAVSPDGEWIYAGDFYGAGLWAIDADTETLYTTVPVTGALTCLEVSADGDYVYACGQYSEVWKIDVEAFSVVDHLSINGQAWEMAMTGDGTQLFVGNLTNQVAVIDTLNFSSVAYLNMPGNNTRGVAITPQYVAKGVFLTPMDQAKNGGRGETVTYEQKLFNNSGTAETYNLQTSGGQWNTQVSTPQIGPIASGESANFSVSVVVPVDAPWYSIDYATLLATGVTSPALTAEAQLTTTAFATAQIGLEPASLESTQYVGEVTTQTITISNGPGITLTYEIVEGVAANDDFSTDTGLWDYVDSAYRDAVNQYVVLSDVNGHCSGDMWLKKGIDYPVNIDFDYLSGGGSGADGFVVMFYKDSNYLPGSGGCLAFGDTTSCYAQGYGIEFDTYTGNPGDPWEPHIGLIKDTPSNHLLAFPDSRTHDYIWHGVHVSVDENSVTMDIDGQRALQYEGAIDTSFDKVGFGGSCGAYNDWHIVDNVRVYSEATQMDWLSFDHTFGSVPTNAVDPIQAYFDTHGMQPGQYPGAFLVDSNDPLNSRLTVPVSLTVEPTADMGQVAGTVTDAWTGDPLSASVELEGVYTANADPDYDIWAVQGTYSLTAYTAGYYTITLPVEITAGELTLQDIALEPAVPRMGDLPDEISISLAQGVTGTQELLLDNSGPVPLGFAFFEINPLKSLGPANNLEGKKILFDRAHCQGDRYSYSILSSDLEGAGATIDENFDPFDEGTLDGYDILWLNDGSCAWTYSELQILSAWLADGGAVLVQSENTPAASMPASIFGITYESGSCNGGTTFNINDHPITEGIDEFYIDWNCGYLAGSPEAIVLDQYMQTHVIASVQGRGKMVVLADNDFYDWIINDDDNRLFAMNAFQWLAFPAYSDIPWLSETPEQGSVPGHSSLDALLTFDARALIPGVYDGSLVIEHDDPNRSSPIIIPVQLEVTGVTAPASVLISGPETGLVGESQAFTAQVAPDDAVLPLTYLWEAEGQQPITHTGGLTDDVSYIWDSPGTYQITVTVSNEFGTVTTTSAIVISSQIYPIYLPLATKAQPGGLAGTSLPTEPYPVDLLHSDHRK